MKKRKNINKILYVSYTVPPLIRGQAVIMYRLFSFIPPNNYIILTQRFEDTLRDDTWKIDEELKLPCHYYYWKSHKILSLIKRISPSIAQLLLSICIFLKGLWIVYKHSISHLLVVPKMYEILLATYWLHKLTGIPMSIYLFDIFDREDKWGGDKRKRYERRIFPEVSNIFVMSEPLQRYYRQKYQIEPKLLHHPISIPSYPVSYRKEKRKDVISNRNSRIVFTGMIYEAQRDAIVNLIKVLENLSNIELHIYTPVTLSKLKWMGISGRCVIYHGLIPYKEVPVVQQNADILFLPMSFKENVNDLNLIKTASPSKLPEYLASGQPILIHAPEYSYISWYGKHYKCAEVVDIPDLEKLRKSVLRLKCDERYRDFLIANAKKAVEKHDAVRVSKILQELLEI